MGVMTHIGVHKLFFLFWFPNEAFTQGGIFIGIWSYDDLKPKVNSSQLI